MHRSGLNSRYKRSQGDSMARNKRIRKNNEIALEASFSRKSSLTTRQVYLHLVKSRLGSSGKLTGDRFTRE